MKRPGRGTGLSGGKFIEFPPPYRSVAKRVTNGLHRRQGSSRGLVLVLLFLVSPVLTGCRDRAASATGSSAESGGPGVTDEMKMVGTARSPEGLPGGLPGFAVDADVSARPSMPTDLLLPEEETSLIWDREHHGNLLGEHGFKQLNKAVRQQDREAIRGLLADDFQSRVLPESDRLDYHSDLVTAARWSASGELQDLESHDAFIDWLLRTTSFITEIAGVQVGVLRISPVDTEDGSWQVEGVLRAWGKHDDEPGELRVWVALRIAKPSKENLLAGKWIQQFRASQIAVSQAKNPLFLDQTAKSGVVTETLHDNWETPSDVRNVSGGVYFTDFDNDGHQDMLLTDVDQTLEQLYRGKGDGTFVDVSAALGSSQSSGLLRYSSIAAWIDLNGDGWDDIIYADGVVRQNIQGLRFRDVSNKSNFSLVAHLSDQLMGMSVEGIIPADFDRDGKIDLFLARLGIRPKSWLEDASKTSPPCQLLRNLGNWRFEDVSDRLGPSVMGRSVFSAVWSDFNNDGWPDLYSINEFGDGIIYFNREGKKFDNVDIDPNIAGFGAMGVTSGDFENDGNVDIYAGEMYSKAGSRVIGNMKPDAYDPEVMTRLRSLVDGSELYHNLGNEKFEGAGKKMQVHDVGWAWGPVAADFDNNGFLDIYATAGYISRDRDKPDG